MEGPRTESQYEESFTRLARSQGPRAEEGQGGESPGIGAGRALLATLTILGHGEIQEDSQALLRKHPV